MDGRERTWCFVEGSVTQRDRLIQAMSQTAVPNEVNGRNLKFKHLLLHLLPLIKFRLAMLFSVELLCGSFC